MTTDSPSGPTWAHFRAELLALYRASRAPKTAAKMRQVLDLAEAILAPASPADLTPDRVADFSQALAARGMHPNTRAGLLSYLRRACSYATRRHFTPNPFALWPGLVRWEEGRHPGVLSPAQIGRALAALAARSTLSEADGRLHAWASVLAYTGLRRDEALFLAVQDVDLARGLIRVRRRLKRPTARREAPIPPALMPVLVAWMPRRVGPWLFPNSRGNPWSGGACGYRPADKLRAAGEAAGVPGFTPSALRHSFATNGATAWGMPPATLQRLMGHTDVRTTMKHYVHLDSRALIEAARAIAFPAA